jgi:DNA-binding NtrC family response regulator
MKESVLRTWVVDDDPFFRQMLVSYLELLGHQPRSFENGEEFLWHVSEKPDVVLLDQNLGDGMKGMDILRKLKSEYPETHVVFISGEENIMTVSDSYQYGSEEFMDKDSAALLRIKLRLEKILTIRSLRKRKKIQQYKALAMACAALGALGCGMLYMLQH